MTTSQPAVRTPASAPDQTFKRRGLLAAGAAFVAGLVAKLSEQSVSAGIDGDLVLGQPNTTSTVPSITNTTASSTALELTCTASPGGGWGLKSGGSLYGVSGSVSGPVGAGVVPDSWRRRVCRLWPVREGTRSCRSHRCGRSSGSRRDHHGLTLDGRLRDDCAGGTAEGTFARQAELDIAVAPFLLRNGPVGRGFLV
jgi:hypothetical protein